MTDLKKIVEDLSSLTVLEVANLSKLLEKKWGIEANTILSPTATPPINTSNIEKKIEEKTEFDVILSEVGEKKIDVIKAVRSITGLGLKESKSLVDNIPSVIKKNISKDDANKAKEILEKSLASVILK